MKESTKRMLGVLSFLPLLFFIIGTIYFLVIQKRLIDLKELHQAEKVISITNHYYVNLFVLGAIFGVITAYVLIYYAVHLARVTHMNAGNKIGWLMFLLVFNFVAFPIFWWVEIRNEPEDLPMYSSIE